MKITNGVTWDLNGITINDVFPIAVANTLVTTQNFYANNTVNFNPFTTVYAGVPPYTYGNVGALPQGVLISSGNGLVYGNTSSSYGTNTVTFIVTDNNGVVSPVTNPVSFTVYSSTYTMSYVIVGGGGGAFYAGGSGGYVTQSTSNVTIGESLTITVGGGGAVDNYGGASAIIGPPGFVEVSASGGGFGQGSGAISPYGTGYGGGGGGGSVNIGTSGYGGSTIPGYTYAAGGAGGNGITTPVGTFAGGGGGGAYLNPAAPPAWSESGGAGGPGGGGHGGTTGKHNNAAVGGTPGLGGGGGSDGQTHYTGGSGTIILLIPTPYYPGSAPGASVSTSPAAPGYTVLTYTSSGTYIA